MPTFSVSIKNMPQIKAAFRKAPLTMAKKLNDAIQKSAFIIERDSKRNTPVLTGRLRASHQVTYAPLKATIEPTAEYAIYVHEGTRRMKARPFLFNAVRSDEGEIQRLFTDAVDETFNEIRKSA